MITRPRYVLEIFGVFILFNLILAAAYLFISGYPPVIDESLQKTLADPFPLIASILLLTLPAATLYAYIRHSYVK